MKAGSRSLLGRVVLAAGSLVALATQGAMDLRIYDEARHDRFYTGGSPDPFLRDAADWSGVGQSGAKWATMVSPSFYLSASHWHAGTGSTLTFYDDMGNSHSYTVSGGQQIPDSDLWLGWLGAPVPQTDHITNYPVYADLGSAFIGYETWSFGQDAPEAVGAQRMGRNIIDGVGTERTLFLPPAGHNDGDLDNSERLMVFSYEPAAQSAVGGDEMRFAGHDSGGPTFASIDGTFYLAGINYFIYDVGDRRDPLQQGYTGSGVTSVPAYINAINEVMAARGSSERLTVVPEPSLLVLITVAGGLFAARRPRRSDMPLAA